MAEKPDSKPSAPAPSPFPSGPAPSKAPESTSPPSTPEPHPSPSAPPSDPKEAPTMAESSDLKPGNECPKCGHEVERYHGDNPHKQKTYWCPICGERRPIKA